MKLQTAIEAAGTPAIFKLLPEDRFFKRMTDLHELIARRAYELFAERGFQDGHELDDWLMAESQLLTSVPLDISETPDAITVKAALPGYSAKNIEIHVDRQRLFLSGQQREKLEDKEGRAIHSEQRLNRVFRSVDLPTPIDPENVKASLRNGELQIELPKLKAVQKVAATAGAAA